MTQYLLRRVLSSFIVIVLVLTFLALLVRLIPGDPIQAILGGQSSDPALTERLRAEMGVDDPVPKQVGEFIWNAVQGDLGTNVVSRVPVADDLAIVLPGTLLLAGSSLLVALVVGAALGVLAAARAGGFLDQALGALSVLLLTIPSYVAALYMLLLFSVWLNLLPSLGEGDPTDPGDYLKHLIMPVAALSLAWIGLIARLVRASMLEVVNEPYIRTARAFGLSEPRIFLKYGLKNALIPTLALIALGLGNLLAGAVFVEIIFARPGLGSLLINAIETRNFPVVRGAVFTIAVLFVVINLCADVAYRFIDPRVRVERA